MMVDQSENMSNLESKSQDSTVFVDKNPARKNRVHCIVNEAAVQLTANVLLAICCEPSMTNDAKEAKPLIQSSDALSINLGMLSDTKRSAIHEAVKLANLSQIPWVLDPVFVDRSKIRANFCRELVQFRPIVIRANKQEIQTLCDFENGSIEEFSQRFNVVLVETGKTDRIVFKDRTVELVAGHPWMSQVTGMGCALSAMISSYITRSNDPFSSVYQAVTNYTLAGSKAAEQSQGPGTFVPNFLDQLSHVHEQHITR